MFLEEGDLALWGALSPYFHLHTPLLQMYLVEYVLYREFKFLNSSIFAFIFNENMNTTYILNKRRIKFQKKFKLVTMAELFIIIT